MSAISNHSSAYKSSTNVAFFRSFQGDRTFAHQSAVTDTAVKDFKALSQNLSPIQQGEKLRIIDQAAQNISNGPNRQPAPGARPAVSNTLPPSLPISRQEEQYLQARTIAGVNAFWESRFQRGDPVAVTARQFGWPENRMDGTVQIANNKLRSAVNQRIVSQYANDRTIYRTEYYSVRDGQGGTIQRPRYVMTARGQAIVNALYNKVRVDLAVGHRDYLDGDNKSVHHALSVEQVSKYHWKVFQNNRLPASTFGGSPVFGSRIEAWATSRAGLWGKGYDPN